MNLGSRPTSSPKLVRKSSRQSFGENAGIPEELEKRPTPKRSISNLIANLREAQSTMESIEEPVPLTAAQIATDHFTRELLAHSEPGASAETVVILHDACYGHRYSRLKSTKAVLSMIVERPERIHASVLGASAAYVRMGEHYAGAKNGPHPARTRAQSPPFKIRRTRRSLDITSSCVTNVHGTAWMSELQTMCRSASEKLAMGAKELSRSSTPTEPEKRKFHEGDLYLAPESLDAFQGALGGVADAVDAVFQPHSQTKRAFVAIRPPGHHCSADYPSGFCWLNNVHVGIEYAAQTHGLTHAAILDFDLHHGDGSQAITWERNSRNNQRRLNAKPNSKLKLSPDIGYYSMHDINSYPCEMGDDEKVQAASLCVENAHGQSIWNVHLQAWKTEDEFWQLYEGKYRVLLDKAKLFLRHHTARLRTEGKLQPKAAIFISAGFDASEWEGAGMQRHKVNVPTEFYARFTRDVVQLAQEEGTGCEGRVISVLEGGYSDRALCSGVLSHLSGLCATPIDPIKQEGIAEPLDMMNGLRLNGISHKLRYDKTWWSNANLTALENKVNPPPPPSLQGRRVRTGPQPTYATPTESFAYKVIDPNKFARSISGTMREVSMPARPPTPPPPEVDWVVAVHELSKLLIPTDRQTRSCSAEELGGVRTKKDRQSAMPALTAAEEEAAGKPRQLRDRKGAKVLARYAESAHSDEVESVRSVSQSSNRRVTMHELPSASEPAGLPPQMRRPSQQRRLSAGSALSSMDGMMDNEPPPPVPALPTLPPTANGAMKPPPVRPPGASAMQVKKTRAPPPSKPLRRAPSAVPASSAPVSPAISTHSSQQATLTIPSQRTSGASTPASAPALSTASSNKDVENLTSGMKKISLKLGSREEHDRKQKDREAAERRARALKGAETRRVNAAAKKAQQQQQPPAKAGSQGGVPMREGPPPPSAILPAPMETGIPSASVAPYAEGLATTAAARPTEPTLSEYAPVNGSAAEAGSSPAVPLDAPTVPSTEPMGQQQSAAQPRSLMTDPMDTTLPASNGHHIADPLTALKAGGGPLPIVPDSAARQLLQENDMAMNGTTAFQRLQGQGSSSPTARSPSNGSGKKKPPLPVWSSTGVIPFAAPAPASPTATGAGTKRASLKSPRSPSKSSSARKQQAKQQAMRENRLGSIGDGNGVSRTMLGGLEEGEVVVREAPTAPPATQERDGDGRQSVWDMPETPRQQ
ncbi:hypothetical protein LTR85_011862 [Meristemomyces frigidus]|nr:hypothetical protein LTR85_011862 [Meristemomyces frigidus]